MVPWIPHIEAEMAVEKEQEQEEQVQEQEGGYMLIPKVHHIAFHCLHSIKINQIPGLVIVWKLKNCYPKY